MNWGIVALLWGILVIFGYIALYFWESDEK
jgi:hypothetical protein